MRPAPCPVQDQVLRPLLPPAPHREDVERLIGRHVGRFEGERSGRVFGDVVVEPVQREHVRPDVILGRLRLEPCIVGLSGRWRQEPGPGDLGCHVVQREPHPRIPQDKGRLGEEPGGVSLHTAVPHGGHKPVARAVRHRPLRRQTRHAAVIEGRVAREHGIEPEVADAAVPSVGVVVADLLGAIGSDPEEPVHQRPPPLGLRKAVETLEVE